MSVLPHGHFLSLPKGVSKSGQKPSVWARLGFIAIGAALVFMFANVAVAASTEGLIFPGVSVAGKDLSFKTRAQAREILKDLKTERHFTIAVGDKQFNATGSDLGAQYDLDTTLQMAYDVGRTTPLPVLGFAEVNNGGQLGYAYKVDTSKLKGFTSKVVSAVGTDPVNANLKVTDGNIEVVPDHDGLRIDQRALDSLLHNSIADGKDQNLKLEPGYMKAPIQAKDTGPAKKQAEEMLNRTVVLNYEGKQFVADRTAKGYWLTFLAKQAPDGSTTLGVDVSKEQIQGYLQSVANQVDVAPKNKKITVRNGTETVEQEGQDGKAINQAAAADQIYDSFVRSPDTTVALNSSSVHFKTEYNRELSLDYSKYIEINLSQQHLWAYQDHQAVYSSPVTSGATGAGFPTVTGLFAIYAKETNRYLNGRPYGYDYNVFVQYWMPFYAGYGLHDASWRSSFGGQDYYWGGSHGCVNMPLASAAFLYSWADVGTPVWVHY